MGPRTMCVRTSGAGSERLGVLRWGRFTRPGTSSRLRVQSARMGTLRSDRGHSARAGTGFYPRRRRMFLWTGPPRIEDVLFGRGLRSPTEGDGSDAVVWGRSTSWAQNAVLDVPGRPCGAVVGTSQGLPRPRRSALPMRGCAVRRTGAAARRRRRYRSGPAGATSWWSSPRVRVLVAHDGLACQFRAAPA